MARAPRDDDSYGAGHLRPGAAGGQARLRTTCEHLFCMVAALPQPPSPTRTILQPGPGGRWTKTRRHCAAIHSRVTSSAPIAASGAYPIPLFSDEEAPDRLKAQVCMRESLGHLKYPRKALTSSAA
ncbi:hypothetical protein MTO96_005519 [Rhipicephalus appendiculatus]